MCNRLHAPPYDGLSSSPPSASSISLICWMWIDVRMTEFYRLESSFVSADPGQTHPSSRLITQHVIGALQPRRFGSIITHLSHSLAPIVAALSSSTFDILFPLWIAQASTHA